MVVIATDLDRHAMGPSTPLWCSHACDDHTVIGTLLVIATGMCRQSRARCLPRTQGAAPSITHGRVDAPVALPWAKLCGAFSAGSGRGVVTGSSGVPRGAMRCNHDDHGAVRGVVVRACEHPRGWSFRHVVLRDMGPSTPLGCSHARDDHTAGVHTHGTTGPMIVTNMRRHDSLPWVFTRT